MIINHNHKYVFVAVMKTGSNAAAHTLNKYSKCSANHSVLDDGYKFTHFISPPILEKLSSINVPSKINFHVKSSTIKDHFENEGWNFENYFKFGFVRNPWDRAVSGYSFSKFSSKGGSFKIWLEHFLNKNMFAEPTNLPQSECLTDVDYVARFENYDEEITNIFAKIGLPLENIKKYHTNKTNHKPYWEYYDNEDIIRIENWFKKDIEIYKYKFGE